MNTKTSVRQLFENFYLVGGTGLSLQIGHRISIDIDLFTRKNFDTISYLEYLEK
ncbi:MAG: nucleotidyl transferase AbiEii/AbiGii toxin family protein [Bacteroidales bacterium]|nr:nucleotidyl transferase AbiEii/AbiGii toxin family protein [Bacteroidales bacterium]